MELVKELKGKTVITADHGQLFGKRILLLFTVSGHPWGVHVNELVKVPWVVFEGASRRTISGKSGLEERVRRMKREGKI